MSDRNINDIPWDACTGCCLCQNICLVDAIKMKENEQGFIHPVVDINKCINCGKCYKSCPINNVRYENDADPECHAIWAKDDIRMTAASGGVFSAIAEKILDEGGLICGAAYGDELSVIHIVTDSRDGLNRIKSSKYVQSNAGLVYREVKEYLEQGRLVLFSGCPCQVAALNSFLEYKSYNNLFTMDIICHGVPSPLAFRQYLSEKFGGKEIEKVDFRDKSYYGWSTTMNIYFKDGDVYREDEHHDSYYRAFLPILSIRKSCSKCIFSHIPRQGDWSIGDFWGISRVDKTLSDKKGTSLLLVNNSKGKDMLQKSADIWERDEIVSINEALVINKTISEPFKSHPARNRFFSGLGKVGFDKLVDKCLSHHYDVGIVGLWYGLNYGSVLTYYALYCLINDLGFDAIMVNKPKELWNDRYTDRNTISNKFIYSHCYVSNVRRSFSDWIELNNHCDSFVVGSDVVWNYQICGHESKQFFFLDFVKDEKKKIAMASSFGAGYDAPESERLLSEYYLSKFDYIGVREKESVDICKETFNVDADIVLDPVFICNTKVFHDLADSSGLQDENRYLTSYILGPDMIKGDFIRHVSDVLSLQCRNISNPNNPEEYYEKSNLDALDMPSVEQWLYYIKNCDFFIGDSFHGLCFSLIFNKPFIVIVNSNISGLCRFTNLLSIVGLEERLVYSDLDDLSSKEYLIHKPIDYDKVNEIIKNNAQKSKEWLKIALEGKKKYRTTVQDVLLFELYNRIEKLEKEINNR